jgi:hypothetical protein
LISSITVFNFNKILLNCIKNNYYFLKIKLIFIFSLKFIMGIGGLGIGDWGLGIGPNPHSQSPIPNPQSPIPNPH